VKLLLGERLLGENAEKVSSYTGKKQINYLKSYISPENRALKIQSELTLKSMAKPKRRTQGKGKKISNNRYRF